MDCPACSRELRELATEQLHVDVCDGGCGGIWFDAGRLARVDEPHEPVDPALLRIACDSSLTIDRDARRSCPRCPDAVVMMRRFTSVDRRVAVDECPACAGIWLDAGELAEIRAEYPTQEARAEASRQQLKDAFGEWMVTEERASADRLARATDIRDKTREGLQSFGGWAPPGIEFISLDWFSF